MVTTAGSNVLRIRTDTPLAPVLPLEVGHQAGIGVGTLNDGTWLLLADAPTARRLAAAATQCAEAFDRRDAATIAASAAAACVRCGQPGQQLDAEGCCAPCLISLCDEILTAIRRVPPGAWPTDTDDDGASCTAACCVDELGRLP